MKQKLLDLEIKLRRDSGQEKTICPKCSHTRKASNKNDLCLSVNIDEGVYNCHHCGWNGTVASNIPKKVYAIPEFRESNLSAEVIGFFEKRMISRNTLLKMKVTQEKVWMPQDNAEVDCVLFNYFRENKIVNKKYRTLDKHFKLEKDAELILYNLDGIKDSPIVIFVEGEMDALSIVESGIDYVVSVPNGASKGNNNLQYLDNCISYFEEAKVKEIVLATDNDEAGLALREELARRFGKDRCKYVQYPEGCKDSNDVLINFGHDVLHEMLMSAEFFPLDGIIPNEDIVNGTMRLYNNGIDKGAMIGLTDRFNGDTGFDKLLSFKTSMLYLVTGIPSHGKSSFLNYIEVLLAVKHGWKFGIYSPEHYPLEYLTYRYAELIVGKPFFAGKGERMTSVQLESALDFIKKHFFFIRPKDGSAKMDELISVGKKLVMRHGIKGFTIDPWNTIDHDYGTQGSETLYIEKSLNKITSFKQDSDLAIFIVAHPRKMGKVKDKNSTNDGMYEVPTLYDISGSKAFYDKADVGISVYRNFQNSVTTVYVQKVKFKHIGEIGMADFTYSQENSRYYPCDVDGLQFLENKLNLLNAEIQQTEIKDEWEEDSEFNWIKAHRDRYESKTDEELPF